jgi:hypothetical protein
MAEPIRNYWTEPELEPEPVDRLAVATGTLLIGLGVVELLKPMSPLLRGMYRVTHPDPRIRRRGRVAYGLTLVGAGVAFDWHLRHPRGPQ